MNCTVLVDAPALPRWKRDCIDLLRERNRVNVRLAGSRQNAAPAVARLLGGRSLRRVPVEFRDEFHDAADVVVDLRTNETPRKVEPAKFGHWFFCAGDGSALSELPGAGEISAGSATFTLELRNAATEGGSPVLRRGRFKSLYSYARSMDLALKECGQWPAISVVAIENVGWPAASPASCTPREARPVSQMRLVRRLARAFVAHCMATLFTDARWSVGLVRGSPASFLSNEYRPQVEWLDGKRGAFFADPFVVHRDGRCYVMGESLDTATRRGFITGVEIASDGVVSPARTILKSATHLSYPYAFEYQGAWYLVPESADEGRVTLYRAVDFPFVWESVATLIDDLPACDSTIVRYGDLWWLFCTDRSRDACLNLFAYHARALTGPWTPHTANPVKTDVCCARPAGAPFVVDGELYRPAQDCSASYGDSIRFCRVTKLNEHEYDEEEVSVFDRSHTISYSGGIVAIDTKTTILAGPRLILRRLRTAAARALRAAYAS